LNFYYTKILNEPLIHYTAITNTPNKTSTQNSTQESKIVECTLVKRGRGRPPKLKITSALTID